MRSPRRRAGLDLARRRRLRSEPSGVLFALVAALVYASYLVISSRFAADVAAPVLALHIAQVAAAVCIALALATVASRCRRRPGPGSR